MSAAEKVERAKWRLEQFEQRLKSARAALADAEVDVKIARGLLANAEAEAAREEAGAAAGVFLGSELSVSARGDSGQMGGAT